ncbi:MAG: group II truncated hemoglobin [Pseudomonadales bacterium]|nr:group II truncated hemoglobin [Pseudomonadales bacterium]
MSESEGPTLYERIGGEAGVRTLVDNFYRNMETLPEARTILAKHHDLADARKKLFEYFTGWFGGPPLFISQYGHPRLRARHMHISINREDRDAWLQCLLPALQTMDLDDDLMRDLLEKIVPMADHMRNHPEDDDGNQR